MNDVEFELLGEHWTIKFVPVIDHEGDTDTFWMGKTDHAIKVVQIATRDYNGNPFSKDEIKITLLHELMHVICSSGQYRGNNDDEPFIEWVARCIFCLLKQKVIK